MRREAARLLFALSLNELNKLDVAGVGEGGGAGGADPATAEVATDLVALARSDDPSCARHAVGALANLSENDATHERLLGWGASFLSKLALESAPTEGDGGGGGGVANEEKENGGSIDETVESGDGQTAAGGGAGGMGVGLVREVTRCLANLAGNYATHEKLLDGGAADALVGSLKREDAVTARFAALGLANLAGQVGGIGLQAAYPRNVGRWATLQPMLRNMCSLLVYLSLLFFFRGSCKWFASRSSRQTNIWQIRVIQINLRTFTTIGS